jgi:uncharacterized peroxidase-related enzyme
MYALRRISRLGTTHDYGRSSKATQSTQIQFVAVNRLQQIDPATATGKVQQLFASVQRKLGFVPNLMRVLGNSPAALEGYLSFSGALAGGLLSAQLREQIALTVAEINGCGYCLSAHTMLGGMAGLSPDGVLAARRVTAADAKSDAALKLARAVALQRGHLSDADLQAARGAKLNDAEIVEVVQHVALNVLTNYTNSVARTVIDFPEVKPGEL